MAEFQFVQDRKRTIWFRDVFTVEAATKEEAIAKVKEAWKKRDTTCDDLDLDNNLEFFTNSSEYMFDTAENMTTEENNGNETSGVYYFPNIEEDEDICICSNAEKL